MSKNALQLLKFGLRFSNEWWYVGDDRKEALEELAEMGLIEFNDTGQWRVIMTRN